MCTTFIVACKVVKRKAKNCFNSKQGIGILKKSKDKARNKNCSNKKKKGQNPKKYCKEGQHR
jgi:hypothetical protein